MIYRDMDTKEVYEHRKIILLSNVTSIEEYVDKWLNDKDERPKSLVYWSDNERPGCFLIAYELFKDKWLKYRNENSSNIKYNKFFEG